MTFKHIMTDYAVWIAGRWTRLAAFFLTVCVFAALTMTLAQTTRRYGLSHRRTPSSIPVRQEVHREIEAPLKPAEILAGLGDES